MNITLEQVGKRFMRHHIFRNVSYRFAQPGAYALLGSNGSGKSTLLRVVAGMQAPSSGKVVYTEADGNIVKQDAAFAHIGFCAPGMEVVEELTLREMLEFHFAFKRPLPGLSVDGIVDIIGLGALAGKPIYDYSSGMKQRVKLAQAIMSDTPVLLLDEPCTNLDEKGVQQYREWMERFAAGRLVLVASNDMREYDFCKERINVEDYK